MSEIHEPVLEGEPRQFGIVPQIEFFQQAGAVGVHGLGAQVVGLGNLPDRLTQGQVPENLDFPGGQGIQREAAGL